MQAGRQPCGDSRPRGQTTFKWQVTRSRGERETGLLPLISGQAGDFSKKEEGRGQLPFPLSSPCMNTKFPGGGRATPTASRQGSGRSLLKLCLRRVAGLTRGLPGHRVL